MFFPSFSPTTLTVKDAFENPLVGFQLAEICPWTFMKCYFHFPTSKTAGIFLRRQQGSSIRERCVAGVPGRLEVFSPFFFFLGGGFSFTPNTHSSSYCTRIKQNTVTVGSSKLLLIQIIIFYGRPLRGDFWSTHQLYSLKNHEQMHRSCIPAQYVERKSWQRFGEQEKGAWSRKRDFYKAPSYKEPEGRTASFSSATWCIMHLKYTI